MPLVRIDAPTASPRRLTALGEAVHRALIDAFAIPADDFFQVLRGSSNDRVLHDAHDLDVDRDDDIAFIQVFLRSGRSEEQKRHFCRALADGSATAGLDPRKPARRAHRERPG